jgi:hypothetical protein
LKWSATCYDLVAAKSASRSCERRRGCNSDAASQKDWYVHEGTHFPRVRCNPEVVRRVPGRASTCMASGTYFT